MTFNFVTYKKIKENYRDNINVFVNLGNNKISFSETDGRFKSQGNFARTFSFNTEGTTARNEEGFIYPIIALCYEACRKGIKVSEERSSYKNDINAIIGALGRLERTYGAQQTGILAKNKGAQIANVRNAIATCQSFLNILNLTSDQNQGESYRKANDLFAQGTNYASTSNFNHVISELNDIFASMGQDDRRRIDNIFADINQTPETLEVGNNKSATYNPKFMEKVNELASNIYKYEYSKYKSQRSFSRPSIYRQRLDNVVQNCPTAHYRNAYYQNLKGKNEDQHGFGDFLYFSALPPRPSNAACRVYLNLKPDLNDHITVAREFINEIAKPEWLNIVSDFKFTHDYNDRDDTVCIYGVAQKGMLELAGVLNKNRRINSLLRPKVANMQRLLYPGIGFGIEPETTLINPKYKAPAWSYGSHRCFLVAWGILRARQEGVKPEDRDYVKNTLFHVSKVFAEHGIELQKAHKTFIPFEQTNAFQFIQGKADIQARVNANAGMESQQVLLSGQ